MIELESSPAWFNFHRTWINVEEPGNLSDQVILLENITERLQLDEELMHTERLASVGRLAAGVAHEIGNPVAGIACLAQDMREETDNPVATEAADLILEQTKRISRILHSLIGYSRSGEGFSHEEVNVRNLVAHAIDLLRLQRDDRAVGFVNNMPNGLLTRGDPHQLTQLFLNLLSNARDASEDKSLILITGHTEKSTTSEHLVLSVIDSGQGIDKELQAKVLEPFYTTKDVGQGAGLGLSLVYSIVQSHNGSMHIHSPVKNNRGTCIEITLPRYFPSSG